MVGSPEVGLRLVNMAAAETQLRKSIVSCTEPRASDLSHIKGCRLERLPPRPQPHALTHPKGPRNGVVASSKTVGIGSRFWLETTRTMGTGKAVRERRVVGGQRVM